VQLSRLALAVLIPSVMALTACSGSGSSTKSAAQPEETPPTSNDGSDDGNDNNSGGNDNNGGGNDNSGGGNDNNGGGNDNSGGGTNPGQNIDDGCLYAAADYQEPGILPITDYLDISLKADTYSIQSGQEMTSADSDLTGTWLLTHNLKKKTSTKFNEKIVTDHHRMVFVIRERNGKLEYAQCIAAEINPTTLAPDFIPLEADSVGDEARLLLHEASSFVKMKIDSNTAMSGVAFEGLSESTARSRVEYSNQQTNAVKISASTSTFGTMSLSAYELTSDHNNVGVYCTVLVNTYESTSQCLKPEVSRGNNIILATRANGNVRTGFNFRTTSDSSSEFLVFDYQQYNGDLYDNIITERLTNLPNQAAPKSSVNLDVSKSRITGSAAIQGLIGVKQEVSGTANVIMDIQIPLPVQP